MAVAVILIIVHNLYKVNDLTWDRFNIMSAEIKRTDTMYQSDGFIC